MIELNIAARIRLRLRMQILVFFRLLHTFIKCWFLCGNIIYVAQLSFCKSKMLNCIQFKWESSVFPTSNESGNVCHVENFFLKSVLVVSSFSSRVPPFFFPSFSLLVLTPVVLSLPLDVIFCINLPQTEVISTSY